MLYLYDISSRASPGRIKTSRMLEKIKKNPRLKHFLIGLISSHKNPRPRLWVRWFVNPFVHKKGRGAVVRSRRSRHDLFPWHRFEVGRGALVEQFTVLNNGAGDILIGAGARVGIGSVVIGPVRMGERAGLGQHVLRGRLQPRLCRRHARLQCPAARGARGGHRPRIPHRRQFGGGRRRTHRRTGAGRRRERGHQRHPLLLRGRRQSGPHHQTVRLPSPSLGANGRRDCACGQLRPERQPTKRRHGPPQGSSGSSSRRTARPKCKIRPPGGSGRPQRRNQPKGDAPRNDAPDRRRQQNDRAAADRERDVQKQAGNRGKTAAERLPATSAPAQEPRATATERPEGSPRREQATGRPANERPAQGQHAADQSAPGQPAQGIAQEETPTTARRRRNRRKPAPDNPGSRETGADMQAASGIGQEPTPNTAAEPHRNGQKATPNEPQGRSADTTAQIRSAAPQPDNRDKASADRNSATAPEPGTASQERPASRTTEPTAESPANDRPAQGQSPQAAPSADASSAAGSPDNR